jgi:integrase/recombinase XerD
MKLAPCLHEFFDSYLPQVKGVSPNTLHSYRDAFRLLLPFATQHYRVKVSSLRLEHLCPELILAFLNTLQHERRNRPRTSNQRLAAFKSFAKMIRFAYPEQRNLAERILHIPQKRSQQSLIGFLYPDEILQVFHCVDLRKNQGFRNYTLLHLLWDSGARASEIGQLNLDYFDPEHKTLAILGKGERFRLIELKAKTVSLLDLYIRKYRPTPIPLHHKRLFVNQRGEELTRHGIHRVCKKYLLRALPPKRLQYIHPVHSFRHSCAVHMLQQGKALTDIRNHLGHENVQSTELYLHLDLNRRRYIQKRFLRHMDTLLSQDSKITELLRWENNQDLMRWLDSL